MNTSRMRRLVLASTSSYRRALLERLGIPFEIRSPDCDETRYPELSPQDLALTLAREKAASLRGEPDGTLVIGSDQVVDLDGEVLGKPHSAEAAVAQLMRMSGRAHRLVTAVAVYEVGSGRLLAATDVHTMTMRALGEDALRAYVAHDQPLDCAGSYKLERRGIALFDHIEADPETADDTAIVGLPIMKLLRLLRELGMDPITM